MYLIGNKKPEKKFNKDDLKNWENDNYFRYEHYPITNCGEIKIRDNDNYESICESCKSFRYNRKIRWIFY
ncbi:hypothetical protein CQA44_09855 [Helicobacter sp. MIT 14-3879]|nr:hypothetical protein CQA44_09855 [Helicobacter sp. MIT 14-3879]